MKKVCIIYCYSSNKMLAKEEYESAYLASYIRIALKYEVDLLMDLHEDPVTLYDSYDYLFLKPYSYQDLNRIDTIIIQCSGAEVFFYGQFVRNNVLFFQKRYDFVKIIESELFRSVTTILSDRDCMETFSIHDIPVADRSIAIKLQQPFVEVCFSKGCFFRCTYCTMYDIQQTEFKTNDEIIAELIHLNQFPFIKRVVIKDLSFEDRIKKYGKEYFLQLLAKIAEIRTDYSLSCNFRAETFSKENEDNILIIKKMKEAGFDKILIGIESFVDKDLKIYNKHVTSKGNINCINLLKKYNIALTLSFIFINPYTLISDLTKNIEMCQKLQILDFLPAIFNVLRPEKNSAIYSKLKKDKLIQEKDTGLSIVWCDPYIRIIAEFFDIYYFNKEFWGIYKIIPQIHIVLNRLQYFLEKYDVLSEEIIRNTKKLFFQINEDNYHMMIKIIQLSMKLEMQILQQDFDAYLEKFKLKYSKQLKETYLLLKKKLLAAKMIERKYINS